MLVSVSTCQGGVMTIVTAVWQCLPVHFIIYSVQCFVSFEGNRNFTIDFGCITFLMKLIHLCLYRFMVLVVLHRSVEIDS